MDWRGTASIETGVRICNEGSDAFEGRGGYGILGGLYREVCSRSRCSLTIARLDLMAGTFTSTYHSTP